MNIALLSHDLSHNCLGRAVVLAHLLQRRHDVQIIGPKFRPNIWRPCSDIGVEYVPIEGEIYMPQFLVMYEELLRAMRRADFVIAVKPRPTSFGVALADRHLHGRPFILDIDDSELDFYEDADWRHWRLRTLMRRPNSPLFTSMLETLVPTADGIFTASRELQRRYGGLYVPHVKDPKFLNPDGFDPAEQRHRLRLPANDKLVVFAGSMREHKGLDLILGALEALGRDDVKLLIVGASNDPGDAFEKSIAERGGDRVIMLKEISYLELPSVLCVADLVVLPQRDTPTARAQMPSKLFDAMSMALPIVASDVSDIAEALEGECGAVVPPEDQDALVTAMTELLEDADRARSMGRSARQRLIERYSLDAVQGDVEETIREVMGMERFRDAG